MNRLTFHTPADLHSYAVVSFDQHARLEVRPLFADIKDS